MSSKKVILFPGSFDPFTLAHEQIVRQALSFFDEVVVGIGCNIFKQGFLSVPNRITLIEKVFENEERVRVVNYDSLTVDFCAKNNIHHIVRGLRNYADFEME
ncbi:MAG: adenylyltransferase/cytidyltransferase family protein, partial [Rikenellaceae bacterium]